MFFQSEGSTSIQDGLGVGSRNTQRQQTVGATMTRRPSLRDRRFGAFLSHYKTECGTEARLVQQNLKQILPRDTNEVFLDSG